MKIKRGNSQEGKQTLKDGKELGFAGARFKQGCPSAGPGRRAQCCSGTADRIVLQLFYQNGPMIIQRNSNTGHNVILISTF